MAERKKKEKKKGDAIPEWMMTYTDMVTLLMIFFITMFSIDEILEPKQFQLFTVNYAGLGRLSGGDTLSKGKLAQLGSNFSSLPSNQANRKLDKSKDVPSSLFKDELDNQTIKDIRMEERGLVISLSADAFFKPASAQVDIENNRETLQKLASFLTSNNIKDLNFKIEGHTDKVATDLAGPWMDNWELSVMRSLNIFEYLVSYAQIPRNQFEKHFEVTGYGDTKPIMSNNTPEGRAFNRRVDIVILSPGSLSLPQDVILLEGN